jgi:hypothetical protein
MPDPAQSSPESRGIFPAHVSPAIDLANLSPAALLAMNEKPFVDPPFIRHIEVWPSNKPQRGA